MAVLCSPFTCLAMLPNGCKSSPLKVLTKPRKILTPLKMNDNFNRLCFFTAPVKLSIEWNHSILGKRGRGQLFVNCQRTDGDSNPSGEEPPETLFMKELKRRGMTPASLLEESDKNPYGTGSTETTTREEGNEGFANRNGRRIFTGIDDRNQVDQRARSMALNSEGLEGLIPRARVLLNVVINSVLDNVNKTGYSDFSYGENGDKMFGFGQCRGDLNASTCRGCVSKATEYLDFYCNGSLSYRRVLLSGCILEYATSSFSVDAFWIFVLCNNNKVNGTEAKGVMDWKTASLLQRLIDNAVSSSLGYSVLSDHGVYSLAECWRIPNMTRCSQCLNNTFDYLGSCPAGTSQGYAFFDNCLIRNDSYKFYNDGVPLFKAVNGSGNKSGPSMPASRPTQGKSLPKVLGLSIGGAVVAVALLGLVVFWKRKVTNPSNRKSLPGCYKPSSQLSTAISKSKLNYKFEILQTATNNFNPTNKIGQGGFGSIYKGVMIDGRQIAVKRLFSNKEDNVSEFFNEVNLISCVQHKNLVKLLGCSVDGPEKLLVYEYLPNKSLDHFLFDENMGNVLDWQRRFDIILGTSCGLAYLHQGSDIRVIHRDIKASNILLDHHFKPKIADFGLVRYFSEDQTHISTGIVGTRGYMAPEYLIHGHLTEKVDVYAFGVLVLEIITGRRNKPPIHTNDIPSLLTMVWNCHLSGTVLDIIDSNIQENYQEEVLKVVHISLLCTQASATLRPSMSEVITFLTSKIQHLLEPNPPPFIDVFPLNPNTNISIAANHSQPNNNTNVSNVASSSSTSISLNTISSSSFRPR